MISLAFAIKHCEEVAESREKMANEIHEGILWHEDFEEEDCRKCAEDHRQLAHWLMELQVYRDGGPKGKWIEQERGKFVCNQCGYTVYAEDADDFHFCNWCGAKMMEVVAW